MGNKKAHIYFAPTLAGSGMPMEVRGQWMHAMQTHSIASPQFFQL